MSLSQWLIPVWLLTVFFPLFPSPDVSSHGLAWLACLATNLLLFRFSRRLTRLPRALRALLRVYFATVLISVFSLVFLVLCGLLWGGLSLGLGIANAALTGVDFRLSLQPTLTRWFQTLGGVGIIGLVVLFVYGYAAGHRELQVTRLRLHLPRWSGSGSLKVAHISDLHIGVNLTDHELATFVQNVNALEPDLILLTGDILDSNPTYIPIFFPYLKALRARLGTFACLGNHDHYAGADAVAAGLSAHTDIKLLRDQVAHLAVEDNGFHLIGLDDRGKDWARGLDADTALGELRAKCPRYEPCLLLSHRPDIFPAAAALHIDLTLSGHTHGGQFALPFCSRRLNLACFITRFPRGLYTLGKSLLYVNRGLGVTAQRIRLFSPREIALITCSAVEPAAQARDGAQSGHAT